MEKQPNPSNCIAEQPSVKHDLEFLNGSNHPPSFKDAESEFIIFLNEQRRKLSECLIEIVPVPDDNPTYTVSCPKMGECEFLEIYADHTKPVRLLDMARSPQLPTECGY